MSSDFRKPEYRDAGKYLGLGINLAVTLIVFVFAGKWLDDHYKRTDSLFLLLCSGFGLFAGLYHFIKAVLNIEKKRQK